MDGSFLLAFAMMMVPVGAILIASRRFFEVERHGNKAPFTEKLLRPPGESLRVKIEEIRDQMLDIGLWITLLAIGPGILATAAHELAIPGKLILLVTVPCLMWAFVVVKWRRLIRLRTKLRNYRLGFDGERYVARELDLLMFKGFHVFHDFVLDHRPGGDSTTFNIDHVIVGSSGLIAVETKARRKPRGVAIDRATVTSDGKALRFNGGPPETNAIKQAESNARELRAWIEKRVTFKVVRVRSVVLLPGWWVEDNGGPRDCRVYNGKKVATQIAQLPNSELRKEERDQIVKLLEAHCRNVDTEEVERPHLETDR